MPPAELPGRLRGLIAAAAAGAQGDIVRAVQAMTRAAARPEAQEVLRAAGGIGALVEVLSFASRAVPRLADAVLASLVALGVLLVRVDGLPLFREAGGVGVVGGILAVEADAGVAAAAASALWLALEGENACAGAFLRDVGYGCLTGAMRAHAHSPEVLWPLVCCVSGALNGVEEEIDEESSGGESEGDGNEEEDESVKGDAARAFVSGWVEVMLDHYPRDSRIVEE